MDMRQNLHKNNAAEWIMWVCLLPAFGIAALLGKVKTKRLATETQRTQRKEEKAI